MPIKKALRWYYPIDWPVFSDYAPLKKMRAVLAAAHLNHDPSNVTARQSESAVSALPSSS